MAGVSGSATLVAKNCRFYARHPWAGANKTDVFKHLSRAFTGVTFYCQNANYHTFAVALRALR